MNFLNQELADTLCTIIACGFIKRENDRPTQKTTFIYEESANKAEHDALAGKLNPLGIKVTFTKQDPKPGFPFILAKPDNIQVPVAEGLVNDLLEQARFIEDGINNLSEGPEVRLPGAYIGGLSTVSSLSLYGGSDLYPYDPAYRQNDGGTDPENNEIVNAYNRAKEISNTLRDFLSTKSKEKGAIKWSVEETNPVRRECACNQVFASVHGMTRSMIHYHANGDNQKVCLELALGKDTCKVASCIPCSIFMSANGTPATATHMGRGDNWNFPEEFKRTLPTLASRSLNITKPFKQPTLPPTSTQEMLENWYKEVYSCYNEGMNLLLAKCTKVREWKTAYDGNIAALQNRIPELFLEALTFESSFMNKINATLS